MDSEAVVARSEAKASLNANGEAGGFVQVDGERYYRIVDADGMPPFLMSLVSGSDHWMFLASNGALTAGRRDADNALFPYCTQDKLFESAPTVGSRSLLWVDRGGQRVLWKPFAQEGAPTQVRRSLLKNVDGTKVIFDERNEALGLSFRYLWTTGDRFGFVRKAELVNLSDDPVSIRICDGIQNLVPYGLDQAFVSQFSNLADAYKRNELLETEGLGIFYLSSIPTDRAEPSEGLKATVAWSAGLERASVLLSSKQVAAFEAGEALETEKETRGWRGSFFVESMFDLGGGAKSEWWTVADINQDAVQVEALRRALQQPGALIRALADDVAANAGELRRKIASSDGLQLSANPLRDARHRSNTLFNIMRGGAFGDGYQLSVADFKSYLAAWNREALAEHGVALDELGPTALRSDLVAWAESTSDPRILRLAVEYLPLSFSRRHGDPSRPWNKFSIVTRDDSGAPLLAYQGNWRDIFQNWEPLAYSYPGYALGMVARFVNSSTADGYNPYRVTREGFDWEVLDPDEPWSNIGYWGDHQIVYLLKLLEALDRHSPRRLLALLRRDMFVFADVPYRIRGFDAIWENPRETVDYDYVAAQELRERASQLGSDGKLLRDRSGAVARANLMEKLLVPLLTKLSNFVPGGGIWMNTQRPEWNDANNALVGYGVSVVTLCYTHRYLEFLLGLLDREPEGGDYELDANLAAFLEAQDAVFREREGGLVKGADAAGRFAMLQALGRCGEAYRHSVYNKQYGETRVSLSKADLLSYLRRARCFVRQTIDLNRRADGMYHSYNLLRPTAAAEVEIDRLPEMLEGQVAVLSSKRLSPAESLAALEALRASRLYRDDVRSYLLYPDRDLPRFLEKNRLPPESVKASALLSSMARRGDGRIVARDVSGTYRFCGDFRNGADVAAALERVKGDYPQAWSEDEARRVLEAFESVFDHRSFTGRSGAFFAYEGLGSVYWHMVSKLALAVQEHCLAACEAGPRGEVFRSLAGHYFETLDGLGLDKTPQEYGAFPTDAYSHTPKHAGAQQPGMTGQVKEDILSRWGELGVRVEQGCLRFEPVLLRPSAFLAEQATFRYLDVEGAERSVQVAESCLAFTYCQTLVRYSLGAAPGIEVRHTNGERRKGSDLLLTAEESKALFERDGTIAAIEVSLTLDLLFQG